MKFIYLCFHAHFTTLFLNRSFVCGSEVGIIPQECELTKLPEITNIKAKQLLYG